jgi:hypothetical protein
MDTRKDEKQVGNVGSKHVTVSTEWEKGNGNCEYTEAETDMNGEHSEVSEGK